MKKVFAILMVIALVAGSAFADGNTVKLKVDVDKIIPAFKLFHGDNTDGTRTITVDATNDLADSTKGITASFYVKQVGETLNSNPKTFSRWGDKTDGTTISLSVECDKFYYYGETGTAEADLSKDVNVHSADPTISSDTNKTKNGATVENALGYNAVPAITAAAAAQGETPATLAKVVFTPKYYGKKVPDQIIGYFEATWPGNNDLPFGIYIADITLSYTSPT